SEGQAVYPTPVVGMVGSLPDVTKAVGLGFREGCAVYQLSAGSAPTLAGSEWLAVLSSVDAGLPPLPDLDGEARLHELLRSGINDGWILSAHDVSEGGLAVALAECAIAGNVGLPSALPSEAMSVEHLFGETPGVVIIGVRADQSTTLETRSSHANLACHRLGVAVGRDLTVEGVFTIAVEQLRAAHSRALEAQVTRFDP
nr:phosphoribosylformylglycinamidine synthase II [Chloroflexia bacterium]